MATPLMDLRTNILYLTRLSGQSACKLFSPGLPAVLRSDAKPNGFACGALSYFSDCFSWCP